MHAPHTPHLFLYIIHEDLLKNCQDRCIASKIQAFGSFYLCRDLDWAESLNDSQTNSGYCTSIGGNAITWNTKEQTVALQGQLSKLNIEPWTTCLWADLVKEFRWSASFPTYCDSYAGIHIASNLVYNDGTTHIAMGCLLIREKITNVLISASFTKLEEEPVFLWRHHHGIGQDGHHWHVWHTWRGSVEESIFVCTVQQSIFIIWLFFLSCPLCNLIFHWGLLCDLIFHQ